jgi:membrane protein
MGLTRSRESFLSIGLIGAAWAASSGLLNMMYAFNVAYGVGETRKFFRRLGLALLMLVAISFFFLGSFGLLAAGDWLDGRIAARWQVRDLYLDIWKAARWLLSLGLVAVGTSLLDHSLPNVRRRWRVLTPGTFIAVLLWVPVMLGFDFYVRMLATYDKTYGALSAFVILMLWFYLLSLLALIAAEINAGLLRLRREAEDAEEPARAA